MAHYLANRGLYSLLNLAISGSTDLRCGALKGTAPTKAQIKDLNFVSDLLALGGGVAEAAASGYARQDLASVTLTENDTPDTVTLTAAAPTYSNPATGETWIAQFYYIEGASDAARVLVSVDVTATSIPTNGANITGPAFSLTVSDPTA